MQQPTKEERLALYLASLQYDETNYVKHLRGVASVADGRAHIRNTMSTTTGSQGGFTVPSLVFERVTAYMKNYSAVRRYATVLPRTTGATTTFATSDGTAEVGERIAQNTTATASDPSFVGVAPVFYKYSSKTITAPFELAQDGVGFEAFVEGRCAERVGRFQNQDFTTGTGSSQPRGVVTGATSGKVGLTGQTTTVIYADLVDLWGSVDAAFAASPSCVWMMHSATAKAILNLTNAPTFTDGNTLFGHPIVRNDDMPQMAANAKSILFGDFSKYLIEDAMDAMHIMHANDSALTKLGQIGYLLWHRSAADLLDPNAIRYYANSAT